jgi:hypothetical protein
MLKAQRWVANTIPVEGQETYCEVLVGIVGFRNVVPVSRFSGWCNVGIADCIDLC